MLPGGGSSVTKQVYVRTQALFGAGHDSSGPKSVISSGTLGLPSEWILIVVSSSLSCFRSGDGMLFSDALAGQFDALCIAHEAVVQSSVRRVPGW
jgi:hypothetical protein